MVIVTVELAPKGDFKKKRHLGTAILTNTGGDERTGNYSVVLSKWGRPEEAWKSGEVKGFPRRKLGPWDLLFMALKATVGKRNG